MLEKKGFIRRGHGATNAPVVDDGVLWGIISVRDVVESQLKDAEVNVLRDIARARPNSPTGWARHVLFFSDARPRYFGKTRSYHLSIIQLQPSYRLSVEH